MKTEHSVTPALDNVAYSSLSLITNSRTVNYFLVYRVNSFNFPVLATRFFLGYLFSLPIFSHPQRYDVIEIGVPRSVQKC